MALCNASFSPVTGWGESKYADLIAATSKDRQYFELVARVARRFPVAFREKIAGDTTSRSENKTLSFEHFRTVAKLEDAFAEYWLRKAAENGWGVAKG